MCRVTSNLYASYMLMTLSLLMVGPWSCESGLKSCSLYKYYRYVDFCSTSMCWTYLLCDIWLNFVRCRQSVRSKSTVALGRDVYELTNREVATLSICYILSANDFSSPEPSLNEYGIPKSKLLNRSSNHIERKTHKLKYRRLGMYPAFCDKCSGENVALRLLIGE